MERQTTSTEVFVIMSVSLETATQVVVTMSGSLEPATQTGQTPTGNPGLDPSSPPPMAGPGGGAAVRWMFLKSSYTFSCRPATLPGRGARLSGREAGNLTGGWAGRQQR